MDEGPSVVSPLPPGALFGGYPCVEEELLLDTVTILGSPENAAHRLGVKIPLFLNDAVPKRMYEFVAGRACAQKALQRAGCRGPLEIGVRSDRAPLWPEGFVGSIAHSAYKAWAVVGSREGVRGLGVDIETIVAPKVAAEIGERILRIEERAPAQFYGLTFEQYLTLVFSAKESLYKCIAPLVEEYLDFQDAACVEVDVDNGRLVLELTRDFPRGFACGTRFDVRFEIGSEVRTAVVLGNPTGALSNSASKLDPNS